MIQRIKNLATSLVIGGTTGYVALTLLLFLQQDSMLFLPRPVSTEAAMLYQRYEIELNHNGTRLHGWFVPSATKDSATLVYYGGNGEEMSRSLGAIREIGDFNYLVMNYRGYGMSEGVPSELALKQDAVFILRELSQGGDIRLRRTHLMGRSLGSGIATHVASELELASLILISPYDSLEAVAASHYPIIPVSLLFRHPFRAIDDVPNITEPTLILKAERDAIIPHRHTDALIEAWQGVHRTVTLPGTNHNHIYTPQFYQEVRNFLHQR
ncbi:MAG: alpha/beta hydrolase [Pseudomonadales bacterium]